MWAASHRRVAHLIDSHVSAFVSQLSKTSNDTDVDLPLRQAISVGCGLRLQKHS
jgi:hypothetical protein